MIRSLLAAALVAIPLAAAPALAQEAEEPLPDDRNSLTIGIGGAYLPSYEGSDDYVFTPVALAFGKVAGFGFATRGTTLTIDLIPDSSSSPVEFAFGPAANIRLDRTSRIKDSRVRALGELETAIELGAHGGVKVNGLLHQYDSLSFGLQYLKDVSNAHDSSILTPSITYATPLSTRTYVSLSAEADRVGNKYARTYFSIDAAGAARSGLSPFQADGGWKSHRFTLLAAQVLTGDLRDPGLGLFGGLSYSRLRGDFAESPIVSVAGSRNQYLATLGLSYTF
jgi:outer membrane scaffolding protein for murein synthesis (MipA/OmpV family)